MAYLPLEDLHFFPSKRDLSDDLNYVLADIPLLAVGILAFCTFTFLALLKRLGILLTVLHLTVVTAFIASIIDLSQVLQREQSKRDLGPQMDSLVKTREIGYALSNSLRFLFFWIFVAEPPKAERDTPNARAGTHSGNWDAWGIVGLALRWGSLCLTIIVFALQVVWRLDSRVDEFTSAYLAESAIEVILSIILAFKILLNCSHCTIVSKGVCLLDYLGFLLSLNLSIGLGIANIIHLKFTETILGRFFQAVNFYLLVLFSLLAVFTPSWGSKSGHAPSFHQLSPRPPASSFNVSALNVSTPDPSFVQPRFDSPVIPQTQADTSSHTRRLSGWLAIQRRRLSSLSRRGDSQVDINSQLWKQSQVERGLTYWENVSKDSAVLGKTYGNHDLYVDTDPVQHLAFEKVKLEAPRFGRGFIKSLSSRYSNIDLPAPQMVDRKSWQAGSPVFGLNGIIRPSTGESASVTVTGPDRSSNISDLFRKQEELENSIAALKLLQGPTAQPSSPTSSKRSGEPSTTRSEFSLSSFPNPPWVTASDLHNPSELPQSRSHVPTRNTKPLHLKAPGISVENVPFELVPPRMPALMAERHRTPSLPMSETADSEVLVSARTQRFDSQGTQYDVTSFIGNLTGGPTNDHPPPGHKKEFSGSSTDTGDLTVASSGSLDPEQTATIVTLQQSKQTFEGSPLARMPVISPTTTGFLPVTRVTLPSRPKLDISQPQESDPQLRADVSPDIFERPRAVPPMH
ncbi:hypothetical protein BJ322DRAFT_769803 [Thelephora terrestris]|uniref:Uncharacterized protein n=1 Tax=Thelephora terrestris TaxID=56493 RepID=A0A9P6L7K8_9AGAM|nr:hypothetical protein BJ322DRAFT_769803 [Thelephora terrestris]